MPTRRANVGRFTIRGRVSDDAVLCTASQTYAIRAVTHSNTFVVATGPSDGSSSGLVVRDQVSQILELVPSVPKVHRLDGLLKGCEYDEGHEEDADDGSDDEGPPVRVPPCLGVGSAQRV